MRGTGGPTKLCNGTKLLPEKLVTLGALGLFSSGDRAGVNMYTRGPRPLRLTAKDDDENAAPQSVSS